MKTTKVAAGGGELVEVIREGVAAYYDTKAEQYRALLGFGEYLSKHHVYGMPNALMDHIDRDDCLREGVCPDCGGDVTERSSTEHHPYGSGTAAERLRWYVCVKCGEV